MLHKRSFSRGFLRMLAKTALGEMAQMFPSPVTPCFEEKASCTNFCNSKAKHTRDATQYLPSEALIELHGASDQNGR